MPLIPAFDIGVWNAWILMLLIFLYILLSVQIFKDVGKKIAHGEEEKKFSIFVALFFFILLIYSNFPATETGNDLVLHRSFNLFTRIDYPYHSSSEYCGYPAG